MGTSIAEGAMESNKKSGILLSSDMEIISKCIEVTDKINCELRIKFDFAEIILELQDHQYSFSILDSCNKKLEAVNWVKVLNKMRARLPIIIISNDIEKNFGAKLYEQNIFYLISAHESKDLLGEIISAAIKQSNLN